MKELTQKVIIVGGGISGLAAAYRLQELHRNQPHRVDITVLDSGARLGGVISTMNESGFLMESGPDAFISEKPAALHLIRRLGMEQHVVNTQAQYRKSFLCKAGKLYPIPYGFYLMAPARVRTFFELSFMSLSGRCRMAAEVFVPAKRQASDETLASFVKRRFGRETLEAIAQPMIAGIYAADPEKLSLEATMPQFAVLERQHGSVIRGLFKKRRSRQSHTNTASGPRYSLFLSLDHGMDLLIQNLIRAMPDVHFVSNTNVVSAKHNDQGWTLQTLDGRLYSGDAAVLALPAHVQSQLLRNEDPQLSNELAEIPYQSVATVNMAFDETVVPKQFQGFGYVVPAKEGRKLIGCTFSSLKFGKRAPEGKSLIRVFLGGAFQEELCAMSDPELTEIVWSEISEILSIKKKPIRTVISRHMKSMPQYHLGHSTRVSGIMNRAAAVPGLFLAGNGFDGIGIPDCIRRAEQSAEAVFRYISNRFRVSQVQASAGSTEPIDHVLLVGFGAPGSSEEVGAYLKLFGEKRNISAERLKVVADHYKSIGGCSPYNQEVSQLCVNLRDLLQKSGVRCPIFMGMRFWRPFLKETLRDLAALKLKHGLAIILAAHRSVASFDQYVFDLEKAKSAAGVDHLKYEFPGPWFEHPLFIEAYAESIRQATSAQAMNEGSVIFTAHSIPEKMAEQSRYVFEIQQSCLLIAQNCGLKEWKLAFQSESVRPNEKWIRPRIQEVIDEAARQGKSSVLLVPIGFLFENTEVLYDLDVEVYRFCLERRLAYHRINLKAHQPFFAKMISNLVQETLKQQPSIIVQ